MIALFMFIKTYWKLFALGAAIIVIGVLVGMFSRARYRAGEAAGRAEVQARWDDASKQAQAAYDAAAAATQARIESDRKAAEEIQNGLREQIASADATGRTLSERVRNYQASLAKCRAVPAAPGVSGGSQGAVGSTASDPAFERLSDDAWAACARDAVRLNAIEDWAAKVLP